MHLPATSAAAYYPPRYRATTYSNDDDSERDREKTYRIYHSGARRGSRVTRQPPPSRGSEFSYTSSGSSLSLSLPIPLPRRRPTPENGITLIRFVYSRLDNFPDRKRREIFRVRGRHEYRRRRRRSAARRVLRIGRRLVYYSPAPRVKTRLEVVDVSERHLSRLQRPRG